MKNYTQAATALCLSFALFACNSTRPTSSNIVSVHEPQANPTVVVLGQRHVSHMQSEDDYLDCITQDLAKQSAPYSVIAEQEFLDAMYPFFERSTAPLNITHLSQMVQEPVVAQKFDDLKLRYVVVIEGTTEVMNQTGALSCAIGPGGGGCFGFSKWDDQSEYAAKVWDLEKLSVAGNVSTFKSGKSYVPAVVLPIPILSGTQDSACRDMAISINNHLTY